MLTDCSTMIADMTRTLVKESKRELEKFLGVTIEKVKQPKIRLRLNVSQNKGDKYRRRLQDREKNFQPRWEVFARHDDMKRSKDEHEKMVQLLAEQKGRLKDYDDKQPISDESPDPASLTAILNIMHAINPGLCELTPVEDGFVCSRGHSYRRKIGHKFITVQTGQAC